MIEAARRYVWHWAGFDQPDNWGAERNHRAFALAQAIAALDADKPVCRTCNDHQTIIHETYQITVDCPDCTSKEQNK